MSKQLASSQNSAINFNEFISGKYLPKEQRQEISQSQDHKTLSNSSGVPIAKEVIHQLTAFRISSTENQKSIIKAVGTQADQCQEIEEVLVEINTAVGQQEKTNNQNQKEIIESLLSVKDLAERQTAILQQHKSHSNEQSQKMNEKLDQMSVDNAETRQMIQSNANFSQSMIEQISQLEDLVRFLISQTDCKGEQAKNQQLPQHQKAQRGLSAERQNSLNSKANHQGIGKNTVHSRNGQGDLEDKQEQSTAKVHSHARQNSIQGSSPPVDPQPERVTLKQKLKASKEIQQDPTEERKSERSKTIKQKSEEEKAYSELADARIRDLAAKRSQDIGDNDVFGRAPIIIGKLVDPRTISKLSESEIKQITGKSDYDAPTGHGTKKQNARWEIYGMPAQQEQKKQERKPQSEMTEHEKMLSSMGITLPSNSRQVQQKSYQKNPFQADQSDNGTAESFNSLLKPKAKSSTSESFAELTKRSQPQTYQMDEGKTVGQIPGIKSAPAKVAQKKGKDEQEPGIPNLVSQKRPIGLDEPIQKMGANRAPVHGEEPTMIDTHQSHSEHKQNPAETLRVQENANKPQGVGSSTQGALENLKRVQSDKNLFIQSSSTQQQSEEIMRAQGEAVKQIERDQLKQDTMLKTIEEAEMEDLVNEYHKNLELGGKLEKPKGVHQVGDERTTSMGQDSSKNTPGFAGKNVKRQKILGETGFYSDYDEDEKDEYGSQDNKEMTEDTMHKQRDVKGGERKLQTHVEKMEELQKNYNNSVSNNVIKKATRDGLQKILVRISDKYFMKMYDTGAQTIIKGHLKDLTRTNITEMIRDLGVLDNWCQDIYDTYLQDLAEQKLEQESRKQARVDGGQMLASKDTPKKENPVDNWEERRLKFSNRFAKKGSEEEDY